MPKHSTEHLQQLNLNIDFSTQQYTSFRSFDTQMERESHLEFRSSNMRQLQVFNAFYFTWYSKQLNETYQATHKKKEEDTRINNKPQIEFR